MWSHFTADLRAFSNRVVEVDIFSLLRHAGLLVVLHALSTVIWPHIVSILVLIISYDSKSYVSEVILIQMCYALLIVLQFWDNVHC